MVYIIIFFVVHWYGSLLFQSMFHHRYAAHAQYELSPVMEKVFFILSWVFMGSNYLSPYGYGVMHRQHHAWPDTEKDPHSPQYDKNIFAMMWRTKSIYSDLSNKRVEVEERFSKGFQNGGLLTILQEAGLQDFFGAQYTLVFTGILFLVICYGCGLYYPFSF